MIARWIWVLVLLAVWWLVRTLLRQPRPRPAAGSRPGGTPRFEGTMVRDRICNTFLPRSRAIVHREGGEEHYFCSEACRSAFLARRSSRAS